MSKKQIGTILIVEDDASSGEILKRMLEKNNYQVSGIVESGEDAIKWVRKSRPDLILMDITLKGSMDGIEAADIIHAEMEIPFIYITGWSDDTVFNRAKKTMPLGYILKPFNSYMIKSSIDLALYKFHADDQLRESEKRNREILSYIPDIMFKLRSDGSFIEKQDREMAKNIWPAKVSERAINFIASAIKSEELQFFDYFIKKGGELKYYEARITSAGEDSVLVIVRDMTEKKKVEIKLNEYKENLESLVEERTGALRQINENLKIFSHVIKQSPNCIIIVNQTGIVEFVNHTYSQLAGYDARELEGINLANSPNLILPEEGIWEKIVNTSMWRGEFYNITKKGGMIYMNVKISTLRDDSDRITHYLIIGEDITERKQQERDLEHAKNILDKSDITKIDMEMDWKEWKEKMLSRNVSRTDKSLFRNINMSFTQGAGLGSMISMIEFLFTNSERTDGKYLVDASIAEHILKNVDTAKTAFKTFANIDWVISHDFDLEKTTLYDFYYFIRIIKSKAEEFCGIKGQKIIINDFDANQKQYFVSINKEFLYKAVFEVLLNAMKFSKSGTTIVMLISVVNMKAHISVTNEPEKGENDVLGIPKDFEKLVFEPFYRLSRIVYEEYKSLDFGIGLTLIEKIISKHKGEVFIGNVLDHSDLRRDPVTKVNITLTLPAALS